MDPGVAGKLVIVTGSTAGIGLAIARAYYNAGARVLVNGRTAASVEKAIEAIKGKAAAAAKDDGADAGAAAGTAAAATAAPAAAVAPIAGGELIPLVGTVSTAEGVAAVIAEADKHGEVQILVNNVGIYAVKPFEEITDDEWLGYHETNVMSCVRLCRHYLPRMKAANWGRVVLISSEVAERPLPHMVAYSASKASQVNLARGLAELTKGTNVTVNSVLPGPTWTEGVEEYMKGFAGHKGVTLEEAVKGYFSETETTSLIQRYLTPAEVANTVLFLGSQLGAGINGNAQRVEGGVIRHI